MRANKRLRHFLVMGNDAKHLILSWSLRREIFQLWICFASSKKVKSKVYCNFVSFIAEAFNKEGKKIKQNSWMWIAYFFCPAEKKLFQNCLAALKTNYWSKSFVRMLKTFLELVEKKVNFFLVLHFFPFRTFQNITKFFGLSSPIPCSLYHEILSL